MAEDIVYENYFDRYTANVKETDIASAFAAQQGPLEDFLNKVSEEKSMYAYAEGKWTLKEMLQHLIDCERVFTYRALVIARKDMTNLPGFEEDDYAANSAANTRTWQSLSEEMRALRAATTLMFASFTEEMLHTTGQFNSNKGTPERLGFIIAGHLYHHVKVAEERYL